MLHRPFRLLFFLHTFIEGGYWMANKTPRCMEKMNGFMFFEPDLQLIFYVKYETKAWGDGDGDSDGMREWECLGFCICGCGAATFTCMALMNTPNVCIQKSFTCAHTRIHVSWKAKPQPLKSFIPSAALFAQCLHSFLYYMYPFVDKLFTNVSKADANICASQVCLLLFSAIISLWIILHVCDVNV